MFLSDPLLSDVQNIRHGFFGRNGGASRGIFASLNCGLATADDPRRVRENRAAVSDAIGVVPDNLLTLHQIHSDVCLQASAPWLIDERPQADAMVTDVPRLALGVLTADCAPVLFHGTKADGSSVVGAAHAGWSGALKGILEATVVAMKKMDVDVSTIKSAIGPCIMPESYEVRQNFELPFVMQDAANEIFFRPGVREGHLNFDLPAYCAHRLMLCGVKKISIRGVDTYFNENDYFSFRRSTHREEPDYGRQISVIAISP